MQYKQYFDFESFTDLPCRIRSALRIDYFCEHVGLATQADSKVMITLSGLLFLSSTYLAYIVPAYAKPSSCVEGCTKHGTCNEELGR